MGQRPKEETNRVEQMKISGKTTISRVGLLGPIRVIDFQSTKCWNYEETFELDVWIMEKRDLGWYK